MISIYFNPLKHDITGWRERLDRMSLAYQGVEDANALEPRLVDKENDIRGLKAIDEYLEDQEQFVNGWYEDRCDKYEFDPDAPLKIKGVNE